MKGVQAGYAYAKKHFFKKKDNCEPIEVEVVDSTEDETEE